MTLKSRKRWALFVLVVGLPAWIVLVVTVENALMRAWGPPPFLSELVIYVGAAFLWAMPFKALFTGIGAAGPDSEKRP